MINAITIPERADDARVSQRLYDEFDIEIGSRLMEVSFVRLPSAGNGFTPSIAWRRTALGFAFGLRRADEFSAYIAGLSGGLLAHLDPFAAAVEQ